MKTATLKPAKTVGINYEVFERVEAQAKLLGTKPGKVVNFLLARSFSETAPNLPLKRGVVLP